VIAWLHFWHLLWKLQNANYITSKDVAKNAKFPAHPTHLPLGWNCKSWGLTAKAIFLHTGRPHNKWLLLHNFVLMRLENLHISWIYIITFGWTQFHTDDSTCTLIFCRRLAENYITVPPSTKCMDWSNWWYNLTAHLVSSLSALDFFNMSQTRKSTSPTAMQVKKFQNTVGSEQKLDKIRWNEKGEQSVDICRKVRFAHTSVLTISDNAGGIKKDSY